jgi:hypothetical protein
MARRKRRTPVRRCRFCGDVRLEGETFYRGICPRCRFERARRRRVSTGARALARAKDGGVIDRDGQAFRVVVLPPKRRGGNRIR